MDYGHTYIPELEYRDDLLNALELIFIRIIIPKIKVIGLKRTKMLKIIIFKWTYRLSSLLMFIELLLFLNC